MWEQMGPKGFLSDTSRLSPVCYRGPVRSLEGLVKILQGMLAAESAYAQAMQAVSSQASSFFLGASIRTAQSYSRSNSIAGRVSGSGSVDGGAPRSLERSNSVDGGHGQARSGSVGGATGGLSGGNALRAVGGGPSILAGRVGGSLGGASGGYARGVSGGLSMGAGHGTAALGGSGAASGSSSPRASVEASSLDPIQALISDLSRLPSTISQVRLEGGL